MKFLSAMILASLFSAQVLAAHFSPVPQMSSQNAQKLSKAAIGIINNKNVFGDSGAIKVFTFTRKSTETNLTTTKQLSFIHGATSDDNQEDFKNADVKKIVDFALFAIENQENENANEFKIARSNLTAALKAIKADKSLEVFGNQHADEDGSWNILFVFDTKTNQVLMVKIGYSGT